MEEKTKKTFEMKVNKEIAPNMMAAILRVANVLTTRVLKHDDKCDMFTLEIKDGSLPDEFVGKTLDCVYNSLRDKLCFCLAEFIPNLKMGMVNYLWANDIKYITQEVKEFLMTEIRDKHWCFDDEHKIACIENDNGEFEVYRLDSSLDINNAIGDIFNCNCCPVCGRPSGVMIAKMQAHDKKIKRLSEIKSGDKPKRASKVIDFPKGKKEVIN